MADSDDEYDRKRRDKFRGERGSAGDTYRTERRDDRRGPGVGGVGRDDWGDRNPFRGGGGGGRPRPGGDYREYRGPRDRFASPGRDLPPAKRMRPDWADDLRGPPRFGYDPYLMHAWNEHYAQSLHGAYGGHLPGPHAREPPVNSDMPTQPAMMTLKQFLDTQDDNISDSEVMRKYNEYKLEFKRQQLNEFFVAHKDEEWFKNKYHPTDSVKRKEEQLSFLQRRVDVFQELLEKGQIKSVSVDTFQNDPLLRLLDTVVIKLEGGTDEDLKILDEKPKEPIVNRRNDDDDVIITSVGKQVAEKKEEPPLNKIEDEPKVVSPLTVRRPVDASDEENWDDEVEKIEPKKEEPKKEKKSLKRKRNDSDSSSSSSSSSSDASGTGSGSGSSSSDEEDDEKVKAKYDVQDVKQEKVEEKLEETAKDGSVTADLKNGKSDDEEVDTSKELDDVINQENGEVKAERSDSENSPDRKKIDDGAVSISSPVALDTDHEKPDDDMEATEKAAEKAGDDGENEKKKTEAADTPAGEPIDVDTEEKASKATPRALHRTSSIFLRNLAPAITKDEIEQVCLAFDGYLRVAIADPLPERRWYRRGWVTFKRDVNIKEICWNLNNTRLRDCEMGAIVNRDLSRRVRPVNGMTAHKTIVRADIKLCAKIALNLDEKFQLWEKRNATEKNESGETNGSANANANTGSSGSSFGFKSNNPALQNITDFLIEEASAEEDELLGLSGKENNKDNDGETVERDPQLISVLDTLILYLRIVHSVDFYNHCEYPYEDEMPNRCGIIHARGPPPARVSQAEMQDYIKNFENKMQTFLAKTMTINEEELKNLGCKDTEVEVEKFVQANTQELAKEKWLCPLSGKKFKGPEFIRKHIFNKHAEKVDEVRREVEFFNNYLRDPKRPQLPEHPGNRKRTASESSGGGAGGFRPPIFTPAGFPPPYAGYAPPMMMPGRGGPRGFGGGRRPPNEPRKIIQYRDLDAPQEDF